MSTLNQENLKLWIEDLRTTEAQQTTIALHDKYGFCCMGRLCVVVIANGVNVVEDYDGTNTLYDGSVSYPPPAVQEWIGYCPDDEENPTGGYGHYDVFAKWNDEEGLSFKKIADRLESDWVA